MSSALLRRFILLLLAAAGLLTLLFIYRLHNMEQRWRQETQIAAKQLIENQRQHLAIDVGEVHGDLLFLAGSPHWKLLLGGQSRRHLERRMLDFSRVKQRYDQIRFLDAAGMERLRINYNDGDPIVVQPEQLQSKAHRYYFADAIAVEPGKIYQSPMDLNVEHGQVELPLKPMIRFATRVTDDNGEHLGVIVLNYFGKLLLDEFHHIAQSLVGHSALLNDRGDFLVGFRRDQEWGFMFDKQSAERFPELHPGVWRVMNTLDFGSLQTPGGLFTFVKPEAHANTAPQQTWYIVHWIPGDALAMQREQMLITLLPPFLGMGLILAGTLWLLLWNAERRRHSERTGEQLRAAIRAERDAFVGGPTVVFKYQNRFGWPVEYVSPNVSQVLKLDAADFIKGRITYSSIVAPEFLQRFSSENRGAIHEGTSGFERSQYQLVDGTGQHRWLQDFTSVIRDETGEVTHFIGYINDITSFKQVQKELTQAREHARQLLDAIADPTLVIDPHSFRLELINQAAREVYINGNGGPIPTTCHQLSHACDEPCSGADEPCPVALIRESRLPQRVVHRHYDAQGEAFYVEVSATPVLDANGRVTRIIESHRDITRHEEMKRQLKHLAETDLLTGAYNRLRFHTDLSAALRLARGRSQPVAIIMFDLDHFKEINDLFGHNTGDDVLKQVSQLVKDNIRQSDLLARWGGEEFLILLEGTDLHGGERVAEHLRRALAEQSFDAAGRVTASFGVAALEPPDNEQSLVKRADQALYASKEGGRNRVTSLGSEDDQRQPHATGGNDSNEGLEV